MARIYSSQGRIPEANNHAKRCLPGISPGSFLYEIFQLADHFLPEEEFQLIIHNNKRPHQTARLQAYDLWQAWLYTKTQASQHQPFSMELVRKINEKVMKHTGKETTTTVGRYDSSLGDFRLGEDYNAVYPIANYTNIPDLLMSLCRQVNVQLSDSVSSI